jgi:hypothetical protein
MNQPLTKRTQQLIDLVTDETTKARILALFATKGSLGDGPLPIQGLERFRFAVIKLAMEGPEQMKLAEDLWRIDYRDLLMNADFGYDLNAHEDWCKSLLQESDT